MEQNKRLLRIRNEFVPDPDPAYFFRVMDPDTDPVPGPDPSGFLK